MPSLIAPPPAPRPAEAPRPAAGPAPARLDEGVFDDSSDEPPPWLDDAPPEEGYAAPVGRPAPAAPPASIARAEFTAGSEAVPAVTTVARTALGEQWSAVIRPLIAGGNIVALLRELALQAELVGIEASDGGSVWRLRLERESLRVDGLRDKLQAAVSAALGEPVRLVVEAGSVQDTIARRDTEAREAAQRDAEQLIRGDPAVRELMAQFSTARIVPGSIKPIAEPTRTDPS